MLLFIPAPQGAGHHVRHPVWTIDPALEGGAALFNRCNRQSTTIYRDIHQGAGLYVLVGFLHQDDFSRQCDGVVIPGPFHCRPTQGLGVHVVAEGAQIPFGKWFEVDNGGVRRPFARRLHLVIGKSLAANFFDVTGQLLGGYQQRKANALDAW